MDIASRVRKQLEAWADLRTVPAACGTGMAIVFEGQEVLHLHSTDEAELHLTAPVIARLAPQLESSSAVHLSPGGEWVTVLLDVEVDADLLISLTSAALQAHQRRRPIPPAPPCSRGGRLPAARRPLPE